jgi:hypothetical protein
MPPAGSEEGVARSNVTEAGVGDLAGARAVLGETVRRAQGARLARLATVLLAVDLAFVAIEMSIDVAERYWFTGAKVLSLNTDGGIPEIYGYAKVQLLLLVLFVAWRASRSPAVLAWIGIFAYVQLEDAAGIHEAMGRRLERALRLPAVAGLDGQDLGEVAWFALVGIGLLALLIGGERRDGPRISELSLVLLACAALLAVFVVVVDPLALMLREALGVRALGALEDGGELVMQSLVLLAALAWVRLPSRWEARLGAAVTDVT